MQTIETDKHLDLFIAINDVRPSDLINKLIEKQQLISEKMAKLIIKKVGG